MKATELRIGNYTNEKGKQKQVYSVSNHNAKDYSKVKPIPLTERWLKDFGFKFNDDLNNDLPSKEAYFLNDFIIWFSHLHTLKIKQNSTNSYWHEQYEYYNGHGLKVEIKYIHQLQNLYFALTGKELTK